MTKNTLEIYFLFRGCILEFERFLINRMQATLETYLSVITPQHQEISDEDDTTMSTSLDNTIQVETFRDVIEL